MHGGSYIWAHAQIGQEAEAGKESDGQAVAKYSISAGAAADRVIRQKGLQSNWQLLAHWGVESLANLEVNLGAELEC